MNTSAGRRHRGDVPVPVVERVDHVRERAREQRRRQRSPGPRRPAANARRGGAEQQRERRERQERADDARLGQELERDAVRLLDGQRVAPVEQVDHAERTRAPPAERGDR